jgi:hypothetical protein
MRVVEVTKPTQARSQGALQSTSAWVTLLSSAQPVGSDRERMLRWGSPGRDGADIDDAHRGTGLPTMAAVGCSARAWSKASCNLASLANTTEAAPITANPMRMPIQATMRAKELMRVTVTFRERDWAPDREHRPTQAQRSLRRYGGVAERPMIGAYARRTRVDVPGRTGRSSLKRAEP